MAYLALMPRRGGSVHVATIRDEGQGRSCLHVASAAPLLPRGRQGPPREPRQPFASAGEVIEAIRAMLAGRELVDVDERFAIERSLPHGHVAAVLGVLRDLDLERLIVARALPRARSGGRDGVPAADRAGLKAVGDAALRADARWPTSSRSARSTRPSCWARWTGCSSARSGSRRRSRAGTSAGEGFVLYDLSSSYVEGRCCPLAALGYSATASRASCRSTTG